MSTDQVNAGLAVAMSTDLASLPHYQRMENHRYRPKGRRKSDSDQVSQPVGMNDLERRPNSVHTLSLSSIDSSLTALSLISSTSTDQEKHFKYAAPDAVLSTSTSAHQPIEKPKPKSAKAFTNLLRQRSKIKQYSPRPTTSTHIESLPPNAPIITLLDNLPTPSSSSPNATIPTSFARSVSVTAPTIIRSSYTSSARTPGPGYIAYLVTVILAPDATIRVHRRYSEFVQLRVALVAQYPAHSASIPKLPPKSIVARFRPEFVEARRKKLEYFLACVVLHPVLGSDLVRDVIDSHADLIWR